VTENGPDVDIEGLEKLGEGYEAEIFAWEDGQALRLFRAGHERSIEPERIAIPAALAGGIPAPHIGEAIQVAGREGTVMERIDGENLIDLVGRKPWLMTREAWETGKIHARLNALPAPGGLATAHERVREWIGNVEVPPHLVALAEETLEGLEGGDRFCHSDFHPGNILLEPNGRRVVIDWGFCASGPLESDVARSVALLRLGEPLDPSPAMRVITRLFRPVAVFVYLRGYQVNASIDMALMWRWVVVRAVEHLAIGRAIGLPETEVPDPVGQVEKLIALAQRRAGLEATL
jgi:hypothetical protein